MNTYEEYLAAKKLFETYEMRAADNSLTVDAAYDQLIASKVRKERNQRLSETDWRITSEVEKSVADGLGVQIPTVWTDYRQALRDITAQEGFPHDITWPEEPST